jgi:hypothetical protein
VTALDAGEAKDMPALFPEELPIGGAWRAATIGGRFAVLNPATGEVITSAADADDHADGNRHHAPEADRPGHASTGLRCAITDRASS